MLNQFPVYKQHGTPVSEIPYLWIALFFQLFVFLIEIYLEFRQLRKFKSAKQVDSRLAKDIDDETFKKTNLYQIDKFEFSIFETILTLGEGLFLQLYGFMPWAWDYSTKLALSYRLIAKNSSEHLYSEFVITIIFFAIITAIDMIWSLPFQLWKTFVIEEKFGFNKQTVRLFIEDKIKYVLLMFFIGSPITGGIIAIVRWGGPNFYFYVWGFCFVVMMIMMFIFPEFIAPLFNKYEPLTDGVLYEEIEKLANRQEVKFPLKKLYVMDGSKRSAHSNAFFYGFFNNKRIVLFDTLIKQVETPELLAILGHEIGHWKLGHTIEGIVISQVYLFLQFMYFSCVQNSPELFSAFGFEPKNQMPVFIGLVLFSQVFMYPVDKILNLIMSYRSRCNEFMADNYAVKLGMGAELMTGLLKISKENLGNLVPDSLYSAYHFSHPPLVERLTALEDSLAKNK